MSKQPIRSIEVLPLQSPPTLYGREEQQDRLSQLLAANQVVWLYGPAGGGRRTLAAVVAGDFVGQPGGVLWFSIYHDDIYMLANRVLRVYGVSALTGDETSSLIEMSRALLQQNRPLIILEGPVATGVLAQFAARCTAGVVPMVIVGRSPQDGPWRLLELNTLSERLAEQVYRERGHLEETRRSALLAPLLDYVQGLPLSLVIAAQQWVSAGVSSTHLASLLPRTPPGPEHRALGIYTAAYLLLEPSHQGLFLLLGALFVDRIGLELLHTITGVPKTQLEAFMSKLVERGLCYDVDHGQYGMHELARVFARRRLHAAGQLPAIRARILKGTTQFVQQYTVEASSAMFDVLEPEMDHILGAARHAVDIKDTTTLQTLFKYMGSHGTQNVVHMRGYQALYDRLGRLLSGQPLQPEPVFYVDQPLDPIPPVAMPRDDQPAAQMSIEALQQALKDAQQQQDLYAVARWLTALGDWYSNHHRYNEAHKRYLKVLEYQEALDIDSNQVIEVLDKLATVCLKLERPHESMVYTARALELVSDDEPFRGKLLMLQGDAYLAQDNAARALVFFQQAIDLLEAQGDLVGTGLAMGKAATAFLDQNQFEDAIVILGQSATLFEQADRRDLQGQALGNLGTAFGHLGRWREAGQRHMLALRIAREFGDVEEERFQLSNLAFVAEAEGHYEWAIYYNRQALYLSLLTGDQLVASQVALDLGRLLLMDTNQLRQAVILLEASVDFYPQDEAVRILSRARKRLSRLEESNYSLAPAEENLQKYAQTAYEEES